MWLWGASRLVKNLGGLRAGEATTGLGNQSSPRGPTLVLASPSRALSWR